MTLRIWDTPFSSVEWLVCDGIASDGERGLTISLVEHQAVGPPHIAQSDDPIERVLEGTRPVEEMPLSRKWDVVFDEVVAFKLTEEAYYVPASADRPSIAPARSFNVDGSPWVAELGKGGMLEAMAPGCRHYVVFSSHTVIEIVSPVEPVIISVRSRPARDG